ncbi:Uncharacterised protein [Vibrio cholerae]|nr:Uncharacterised protein [Vibrio cholerae]
MVIANRHHMVGGVAKLSNVLRKAQPFAVAFGGKINAV